MWAVSILLRACAGARGVWGAERVLICVPRLPPPNALIPSRNSVGDALGGGNRFTRHHITLPPKPPSFFSTRLASATILVGTAAACSSAQWYGRVLVGGHIDRW